MHQIVTGATVAAGIVAVLLLVAGPTDELRCLGLAGVIYTAAAGAVLALDWRMERLEYLGARIMRAEHRVLHELRDHAHLN